MEHNITVTTSPVILSEKQKYQANAKLRLKMAIKDLEVAQLSILRKLKNAPFYLSEDIHLHLSINTTSFKIKIDYSQIPPATQKVIKNYLEN